MIRLFNTYLITHTAMYFNVFILNVSLNIHYQEFKGYVKINSYRIH